MEKWNSEKKYVFSFRPFRRRSHGVEKICPVTRVAGNSALPEEGKRGRDKGAACATALSLRSSPAGQLLRAAPSNVCHQEPR